ncbi:energy transducer TonB [Geomobilimonas luticola]|uniref:TonB family protein n=1 Tax=Geomobilimonas luticola TaxID=1114878 RepID=A0ABS5SAQ2_9BACT|nr:energy transducer TonB [Geomobilimonas luticola]MBT0651722.1 TonB family protein [Geomobilimonas luticola]
MSHRLQTTSRGFGASLTFSFVMHLALFFIVTYSGLLLAPRLQEAPVYYVDVVNLPVAHPRMGSPAVAGSQTGAVPQPPAPPQAMQLPVKTPPKAAAGAPATKPPKGATEETSREFEERLRQLEKNAEARHQAAALEALKNRAAGTGRGAAGMPTGTGKEAGSDYASYIHSRLQDVFRTTIAYQSKNPSVVVRLTIARNGRLLRYRIERSSGDRIFEASVVDTITKAEKTFPPPPNGTEFEQGFLFRPQGIGKQ